MNIELKQKYQNLAPEPKGKKGKSGFKNTRQFGTGGSNSGSAKRKEDGKPQGFSGRTIGKMQRKFTSSTSKKKVVNR